MQEKTRSRFWNVLPVVIAAASLGVAGYQQFAIRRLERQITAMLIDAPVGVDADLEARLRKLDAKLDRLASRSNQGAAAPDARDSARAALEPADPEPSAADEPPSAAADAPGGDKPVSVPERLSTREGRTQWLAELAETLELSTAQTGALETILSDEIRDRDEIMARKDQGAPVAERLKELTRLRKESDRRVQAVLDEERFKLYQAHRLGVAAPRAL